MTTYPYEFYVYKDSTKDKCPECGLLPRDYIVRAGHPAKPVQVTFKCAFDHTYIAPPNKFEGD